MVQVGPESCDIDCAVGIKYVIQSLPVSRLIPLAMRRQRGSPHKHSTEAVLLMVLYICMLTMTDISVEVSDPGGGLLSCISDYPLKSDDLVDPLGRPSGHSPVVSSPPSTSQHLRLHILTMENLDRFSHSRRSRKFRNPIPYHLSSGDLAQFS